MLPDDLRCPRPLVSASGNGAGQCDDDDDRKPPDVAFNKGLMVFLTGLCFSLFFPGSLPVLLSQPHHFLCHFPPLHLVLPRHNRTINNNMVGEDITECRRTFKESTRYAQVTFRVHGRYLDAQFLTCLSVTAVILRPCTSGFHFVLRFKNPTHHDRPTPNTIFLA